MYATMSNLTSRHVNNSFTFFKSMYYVKFIFNTNYFRSFFTWHALGGVDSHFLHILVTKANTVEGELHEPRD